ncbi:hypothetical protein MKW94_007223 [Papaver nudicaule]|uniref:F-box domain-containing protein n=1 Tax=Papaver nudicaule TaxID=74823 RepID=A0AA42B2T9_PAPNU|nr:hypothetical protein [Papaver nudicaule]
MALGRSRSFQASCIRTSSSFDSTDKEFLAVVPSRKRVTTDSCTYETPLKNRCVSESYTEEEESVLESIPQDVLVKILCGVDHADLEQLYHVSNKIRDASLIAKQWYFAFSTPSSKSTGYKNIFSDSEELSKLESIEAPNAPRQERISKSRISPKKLAGLAVALFRSTEEDEWSRNGAMLLETVV